MQQRHLNRKQYFCELANTAQTFYMEYLNTYIKLTPDTRVLEIGCGEGGNLLPFAEKGCHINPRRQWTFFANIPYLRNFYTTSTWYLLRQTQKQS